MEIRVGNILLRQWRKEDAERLVEIGNNKKIFDNLRDAFPHPYKLEDAHWFIDNHASDSNKLVRVFAIVVDGKVVGNVGTYLQEDVYRKNAEIGYFLAEEYWGKGIMTTVVKMIVEFLFENYDIIRISAEPFSRNIGSRKCLEKSGFKCEAELKNNVIKNDVIESSCIYSLLREDWDMLR